MRTNGLWVLWCFAAISGGTAVAEPVKALDKPAPTEREHSGFYARTGFGASMFEGVGSSSGERLRGGIGIDVALGASLTKSLVLYGEMFAVDEIAIMSSHHGAVALGPGIAIWLPYGTYVSASAMRIWVSESEWIPNRMGSSAREWVANGKGFGSSFAVGKDVKPARWNSARMGFALHGLLGRMSCARECSDPVEPRPSKWTTRGGMLSMSITFN
jgi:hypothetical protein